MKITKEYLRKIIKEEISSILVEQSDPCGAKLNRMAGPIWRQTMLKKSFNLGGLRKIDGIPMLPLQVDSGNCGRPMLHIEGGKLIAIKLQK